MDSLLSSVFARNVALAAAFPDPMNKPVAAVIDAMLDSANRVGGPAFVVTDEMREDAVGVVHEWAESELDEGEGYGDRLYALCVGTAAEGDADLTDDEADYAGSVMELVADYLEQNGVDSADVDELLGDDMSFGNDVAARIHDVLLDKLPQGDDAMMDAAEKFVGGDDDSMMDATYRKVLAIRGGKKVRIKKRIGGTVRLTAGQKSAVRKMQRKAFSGAAKMKRAKSMRMRRRIMGK